MTGDESIPQIGSETPVPTGEKMRKVSRRLARPSTGTAGRIEISAVIVDYLVEHFEKVSPKVPSVLVAPFVPAGQRLVPGAQEPGPGWHFKCLSLAWYRDLRLFNDGLKEGQSTWGWLRRRRNQFFSTLVDLSCALHRTPRRYLDDFSQFAGTLEVDPARLELATSAMRRQRSPS